jgi:SGNH domain (fused to AT3 domains)
MTGSWVEARRRLRKLALFAAVLATGLVASSLVASGSYASGDKSVVSANQVSEALDTAQSITQVPAGLTPNLSNLNDIEVLNNGDCPAHYTAPDVGIDALHFGECTYGDPTGTRLLDIFGDAHAGMWLTAIRYAAERMGWRVRIFYFPACPAPYLTFYSVATHSPNDACNRFRTAAIAAIRKTHPAMVVVTSSTLQHVTRDLLVKPAQWEAGYSKTLSLLKMPGTQLVVMGDIPYLTQDDPVCLAAHESDVQACATPLSAAETGGLRSAEERAATVNGAEYINPAPWICSHICEPIVGNIRVYDDQYDLSATYAESLSAVVQTALWPTPTPTTPTSGYSLVASDGGIFSFGDAAFYGSEAGAHLNAPIVGTASTLNGGGYWLVASDGGVFSFGDAAFYGSEAGTHLNAPIVGIAATPNGLGYWLVASDGGVFAFGDAAFYGSEGGTALNGPIVGIAATATGKGYWLVASDGGTFAFGDAAFYGSEGGTLLNAPIVGIATTPDGLGYWLVASDGGVFSFGNAPYEGSEGAAPLNAPVVSIAATSDGGGYSLVASDGGVFTFGDAVFYGSEAGTPLNAPVVGIG